VLKNQHIDKYFSSSLLLMSTLSSSHYLPPISTTPAVPLAKFATDVFDTGGAPSLANISGNF
jgi:hypothetical protein